MVSWAKKDREIIPLTWKNCRKVALKIRGFWPENEGKNEATVLDFFLADWPPGIHCFLGQEGPKNDALDLEKLLENGPRNSGGWTRMEKSLQMEIIVCFDFESG